VGDEQLGERVGRVAITPAFPEASGSRTRAIHLTFRAALAVPGMRRGIAAFMRGLPGLDRVPAEVIERSRREFLRMPLWQMARMLEAHAVARPAPAEQLRRCAIMLGDDDPIAPADKLIKLLVGHGIPRELIQIVSGSGHNPHIDNELCPEAKGRNVDDITRCVDAMLATSREGAVLSTRIASTVLGEGEERSAG
jgi:pimeloyl-ACP methyl ester carboxylesterase